MSKEKPSPKEIEEFKKEIEQKLNEEEELQEYYGKGGAKSKERENKTRKERYEPTGGTLAAQWQKMAENKFYVRKKRKKKEKK